MISFGEYLSSYMQKYNLTISGVAAKANMDRTLLSKVLSGDRSLNQSAFKKIMAILTPNSYEEEKLAELYAISHFGQNKYTNILLIRKFLSSIAPYDILQKKFPTDLQSVSHQHEDGFYSLLSSQYELKSCIHHMLYRLSKEKNATIYTNYSFDFIFLHNMLLNLLNKNPNIIDFKHIICIANNNSKKGELLYYINSMPFAQLGYETCYYASGESEHSFDNIFPYYLIGSDQIIFFNTTYTDGFYIKDKNIAQLYRHEFQRKIRLCTPLIETENSLTGLRNRSQLYSSDLKDVQHLSNNLCLFVTEDTLNIIKHDHLDRETIKDLYTLCDINSQLLSGFNYLHIILYRETIDRFVQNGEIPIPSTDTAIVIEEKDRCSFLHHILQIAKQKNTYFSLSTNKINQISSDIYLTIIKNDDYRNSLLLTSCFQAQSMPSVSKKNLLMISNNAIISDYCNFIEYLSLFSYIDNSETALSYIEKQIEWLSRPIVLKGINPCAVSEENS